MQKRLFTVILLLSAWFCVLIQSSWAISEQEEIKIGQQGAAKAEKKYGVVADKAMIQRAQRLGALIAANAQRKTLKYHFSVLNSKDVNALAFPGGYIYFTKGIMKYMTDEQLAFVAGHEVSHVEHRDSVKSLESAQYRAVGIALLQNFVKGADSSLSKSLMGMTNKVISNRYSQSAEFAADKNGIFLMAAAGFDPYKSVDALTALQKLGGKDMSGFLNSLVSTHPITKDRIERAQAIAPEAAAKYPNCKSSAPKNVSTTNTKTGATSAKPQAEAKNVSTAAKKPDAPKTKKTNTTSVAKRNVTTAKQPSVPALNTPSDTVPTPVIFNDSASDD